MDEVCRETAAQVDLHFGARVCSMNEGLDDRSQRRVEPSRGAGPRAELDHDPGGFAGFRHADTLDRRVRERCVLRDRRAETCRGICSRGVDEVCHGRTCVGGVGCGFRAPERNRAALVSGRTPAIQNGLLA